MAECDPDADCRWAWSIIAGSDRKPIGNRRAMSAEQKKEPSGAVADVEREIREGRKFRLEEAIGRLAGPGAMKGTSPIPRQRQAVVEIEQWLAQHLPAGKDELKMVMLRWIESSELLLHNFEQPIVVLAACCQTVLDSDYQLSALVREADVEWGRLLGERPLFEKEGLPSDCNDPYTVGSVRKILSGLLEQMSLDGG
jgi:hypothetical protein